jgi:hypothetical protein
VSCLVALRIGGRMFRYERDQPSAGEMIEHVKKLGCSVDLSLCWRVEGTVEAQGSPSCQHGIAGLAGVQGVHV